MRPALALVLAVAIIAAAPAAASAAVHLRGTAYEFNITRVLLAGATIRVAEEPGIRATARRDGTYDLRSPIAPA